MIETKQELLNHFTDINYMYNNPFMYQTLSNMIDELLEQQPFINKPCISEGVCREDKMQTLDKIRTEIEQIYQEIDTCSHNEYENAVEQGKEIAYENVIQIIDKYRTEVARNEQM